MQGPFQKFQTEKGMVIDYTNLSEGYDRNFEPFSLKKIQMEVCVDDVNTIFKRRFIA